MKRKKGNKPLEYAFVTLRHIGLKTRLAVHPCILTNMAAAIKFECWTKSLKIVPETTLKFVEEWAKLEAKVPKKVLIQRYSNFYEGYIFGVEGSTVCCCL